MTDLHAHTLASDGELTAAQLVALAASRGVRRIAVTDHDTTAAVSAAEQAGLAAGVSVVAGIEISAYDFTRSRRAHILGLFVTRDSAPLEDFCASIRARPTEAVRQGVEQLGAAGFPVRWEDVLAQAAGSSGVFKDHVARALAASGRSGSDARRICHEIFARGERDGRPGPGFVPMMYVDAAAAVAAIRAAGGLAVIAHPGLYGNFDLIAELVPAGLRGVEAFHPGHDKAATERALSEAKRLGLLVSGGSDFHAEADPLGCVGLDEQQYAALVAHRAVSDLLLSA